jgi:lysophospholipid acyltransferase (LPLAT)-like uncharacterized protein
MLNWLLSLIVPIILAPIYFLLSFSWRLREEGPPEVLTRFVKNRESCIYVHWHGDELVLVGYYSFRRLAVLSSLSKDGTIMARTLTLLGYRVHRGSSTRGGARGLIGLIRSVQAGSQAALAVDGPKGPIYEVKPGAVDLAQRTGQMIVAVGAEAANAWRFPRAWNKTFLPKPFAKVIVRYGEAIPASEATPEKIKKSLDGLFRR